jgi:hypothetical protein
MAYDKKTLSVKLTTDVIESARIISAFRGVSMTDLLSDILRPILKSIEAEEAAKRYPSIDPKPKRPKAN